ncbi:MAG: hypothetical protein WD469_12745 [Paenibacillaceae bacterium]
MSGYGAWLNFNPLSDKFPDFSGQFLNICAEELINCFHQNKIEEFRNIYKGFFVGCLSMFGKLKPEVRKSDWQTIQEMKIAFAPLLDLLEISGYAKIMSEYYEDENWWKVIQEMWDKYLEDHDLLKTVELFTTAIKITEQAFEIAHRSTLRFSWRQYIEAHLSHIPKREIYSENRFTPRILVLHSSVLLRILAKGEYSSFHNFRDGIGVFIYYYLHEYKEIKSFEVSRGRNFSAIEKIIKSEIDFYDQNT